MAMGGGQVTVVMGLDSTNYESGMTRVRTRTLADFDALTGKSEVLGAAFFAAGQAFDIFKTAMIAGGVVIGAAAVSFGMLSNALKGYDTNLRRAAALGGLSTSEMWNLNDAINAQAVRWGVAGDQIAEGVVELTKAGVTGSELTAVLEVATQAVLGFGLTWQEAADIYVTATRAFASEGLNVTDVFDKIGAAATATRIDFADFVDVFKFVAGTANLVGVSFEDVVAMAATLSQVGINAGIGARGVQTMILSIVQHQADFQMWIDSMGLGFQLIKNGQLDLRGLIEAFKGVDVSLVENADALAFLGRQGIRAFSELILGATTYDDLLEIINDSQGTTQRVATQMLGSIGALWTGIAETVLSAFRTPEFIGQLTDVLVVLKDQMTALAPTLQGAILNFIRQLPELLPPLLEAGGRFLDLFVTLSPVLKTFGSIFAGVVDLISKIPTPVLAAAGVMLMFSKVLDTTLLVSLTNLKVATLSGLGVFAGLMLVLSNAHPALKALGAVIMGVSFAFWALTAAETAAQAAASMGLTLPASFAVIAAAIAGVGGFAAGAYLAFNPPSFQKGSRYVSEDTLAFLHRGERVLTSEENRYYTGGFHGTQHNTINLFDASARDVDEILMRYNR